MVVDGGTYTSNGVGSPAIYSTADIAVNNAVLTANGSEAICIEGLNSIHLFDSDLTGNMSDLEQNDCTWNESWISEKRKYVRENSPSVGNKYF